MKKPLRNINLVSIINGETDLDLIVTRQEQLQWINGELGLKSLKTPRFDYTELRRKYLSVLISANRNFLKFVHQMN